jgi:phosphatidylglycerophosphate synthase
MPGGEPAFWRESLGGLGILHRQLLCLHGAGIARVRIVGEGASAAMAWTSRWAKDPRLEGLEVGEDGPVPASELAVVVDGRHVFSRGLILDALDRGRPFVYLDAEGAPGATGLSTSTSIPSDAPRIAPPAPLFLARVDTSDGRRRAERLLLESLGKSTDGWFSRHLNRPLSLRISRRLAPRPVSPNQMTAVTFLVGLASGLVSAMGGYGAFLAGALLFQLASVLDGVDGELARLRFQESPRGEWLDTVCDDVTNLAYFAGLSAGLWRTGGPTWLVACGIAALALDVATVAFLYWRVVARLGGQSLLAFQREMESPELRRRPVVRFLLGLQRFVKRDAYGVAFVLLALVNASWLALPLTVLALAITFPAVVGLEIRAVLSRPAARRHSSSRA